MDILGGERITVIQRGSGSRDKAGRYRIDPNSVVEIENVKGTINPVPGEVLETLPEGERQGNQRRLITKFEIRGPSEKTGYPGDHIIWEGKRWEVRDVQTYRRVFPHLEARVREIDPNDVDRYKPLE